MLAAVGYAFYRRLVMQTGPAESNREGLLILSLIAAIMITDLLFDGFRFALLAVRRHRRCARAIVCFCRQRVLTLSTLSHEQLVTGYQWSYWIKC